MRTDKRQAHARTRGRIRVRYGRENPDRMAFTQNVSETGAFIRTNHVFAPGQTIKVEFNFQDRSLTLHARVVWAKRVPAQLAHLVQCGMGVRFVHPGSEWFEAFQDWERSKTTGP